VYPERKYLWSWLFGDSQEPTRQEKVLEYMIYRVEDEAGLEVVIGEAYVRHNCSEDEVEELLSTPRFFYAACERLAPVL
jgi:hypothetical protein